MFRFFIYKIFPDSILVHCARTHASTLARSEYMHPSVQFFVCDCWPVCMNVEVCKMFWRSWIESQLDRNRVFNNYCKWVWKIAASNKKCMPHTSVNESLNAMFALQLHFIWNIESTRNEYMEKNATNQHRLLFVQQFIHFFRVCAWTYLSFIFFRHDMVVIVMVQPLLLFCLLIINILLLFLGYFCRFGWLIYWIWYDYNLTRQLTSFTLSTFGCVRYTHTHTITPYFVKRTKVRARERERMYWSLVFNSLRDYVHLA